MDPDDKDHPIIVSTKYRNLKYLGQATKQMLK